MTFHVGLSVIFSGRHLRASGARTGDPEPRIMGFFLKLGVFFCTISGIGGTLFLDAYVSFWHPNRKASALDTRSKLCLAGYDGVAAMAKSDSNSVEKIAEDCAKIVLRFCVIMQSHEEFLNGLRRVSHGHTWLN